MKKNAPSILMFGFLASEIRLSNAFSRESSPQVSAIKFQRGILEGLTASGAQVYLRSTLPVSTFPRNHIFFSGEKYSFDSDRIEGYMMPFVNLPIANLISRFLLSLFQGISVSSRKNIDAIFVYSLHTPFLLTGVILKHLLSKPLAVTINDLPLNMAGRRERGLRGLAKKFDNIVLKLLAKQADIIFPVADDIIRDWIPTAKKYVVVEGVAPRSIKIRTPIFRDHSKIRKRVVYTGTFSHTLDFVRMFHRAKCIDADLVFIGGGPEERELLLLAENDERITVKPFTHGDEFDREVENADFFLNPRNSKWAGGAHSFSFKLFDYMASGRPVISTEMRGIPKEYFECFLAVDDSSIATLSSTFNSALNTSPDEKLRRIERGLDILKTKLSEPSGKKILKAIFD